MLDRTIRSYYYIPLCCVLFVMAMVLFNASAHSAQVTLQWNPVNTADGYRVYVGTASCEYNYSSGDPLVGNSPFDVANATTYTIGLPSGTYYFSVTAYNSYGESGYTAEVSAIISESSPVTSVSLVSDLASPQTEGTSVSFTAQADGGSGIYEYQYWVNDVTSGAQMVQDYSSTQTYTWVASSKIDQIGVFARNSGSTAVSEATATMPFSTETMITSTAGEEPVLPAIYVADIIMQLKIMGPNYQAQAYMTILDESGTIVKEATVNGVWSLNGSYFNTATNTTRGDGISRLDSDKLKAKSGDTLTITITDVTKDGYTYNPTSNTETSDSVIIP